MQQGTCSQAVTTAVGQYSCTGQLAYMPSALLLNGLLEDGFALAGLNHVVHLLLSGPLSSHNERPPLNHFSAVTDALVSGHLCYTSIQCQAR